MSVEKIVLNIVRDIIQSVRKFIATAIFEIAAIG